MSTTWDLVDLSRIEVVDEKTEILRRLDGHALFYRGRVHWMHGESESGKTWVCLCAATEVLEAGGRVVYIDFEDRGEAIVGRLVDLGVERAVINDPTRFGYIRPDEPLGDEPWVELWAALRLAPVDLVVIDGVTEAMELEDLDLNSNSDIARWIRLLPRAVATETNAAVVCIDHVTKSRETRGGYAIGGQHKKAAVDGAAYEVETIRPVVPARDDPDPRLGIVIVRVRKDRPGYVRSISDGDVAATFEITSYPGGGISWQATSASFAADFALRTRIADYLRGAPGASKRAVRDLGNSDLIDRAIAGMIEEGHVTVETTASAHRHYLTEAGEEAYPTREGR